MRTVVFATFAVVSIPIAFFARVLASVFARRESRRVAPSFALKAIVLSLAVIFGGTLAHAASGSATQTPQGKTLPKEATKTPSAPSPLTFAPAGGSQTQQPQQKPSRSGLKPSSLVTTAYDIEARYNEPLTLRSTREIVGDIIAIGASAVCIPQYDLGMGRNPYIPGPLMYNRVYDDRDGHGRYNYQRIMGGATTILGGCRDPKVTAPAVYFPYEQPNAHSRYIGWGDNLLYANVNNGWVYGTINESNTMAKLTLPSGAKIVEATLYWTGMLTNLIRPPGVWPVDTQNCLTTNDGPWNGGNFGGMYNCGHNDAQGEAIVSSYSKVQLKIPSKDYVPVKGDVIYSRTDFIDGNEHYLVKANVTHLIDSDPSKQSGDYYVKGVQTRLHSHYNGTFGAWTLVVIYENPNDTPKHISVFDGMEYVTHDKTVDLNGFLTPMHGDVDGKVIYMSAWAGNLELLGEDCLILNFDGNPNCYTVPSGNPAGGKAVFLGGRGDKSNAFRSSITTDGVPTAANGATTANAYGIPLPGSIPSTDYTPGFNLHSYNLHNVLKNGQTKTNLRIMTDKDNPGDYWYGYGDFTNLEFVAFSTMIHIPYLGSIQQDAELSACPNVQTLSGTSVHYTLTFKNTGNIFADDVKLISNFADQNMLDLIDHDLTTVPTLKIDGVIKDGICAKTGWGIQCNVGNVSIGSVVTVDYNVTIDSNITATDFNTPGGFTNTAYATYNNPDYDPPKPVTQPAEVTDPVFISADYCNVHSCVDPALNVPIKTFNDDSGLFVVRPIQDVYENATKKDPFDKPMLVFCKGMKAYNESNEQQGKDFLGKDASLLETWIPLPMSMPVKGNVAPSQPITSNFRFTKFLSDATKAYYYAPGHTREALFTRESKPILYGKKMKSNGYLAWQGDALDTNADNAYPIYGVRVNLDDLTLHESMYNDKDDKGKPIFTFANINLIGTALAIDTSSGKSVYKCQPKSKISLSHYGQVIKADLLRDPGLQCSASKLAFKQLNGGGDYNYRYAELKSPRGGTDADKADGSTELYFSCRDIRQHTGLTDNGFYLIDPIDNKGVPITAYCTMPKSIALNKEELVTTSFLSLDGKLVYSTNHMNEDTCTKLGLAFFVPTSKELFKSQQKNLAAQYSQWAGYTGTNNDWQLTMTGTNYNAAVQFGNGDIDARNYVVWPFGPFGLYNPKGNFNLNNPDDGTACHLVGCKAPLHSKKFETASRTTLDHFGWITIFNSAGVPGSMLDRMKKKEPVTLKDAKLESTFWISDDGCSKYGNADPITGEPNGDYVANTWMNFVYHYQSDKKGDIIHCNDQHYVHNAAVELPPYPYASYSCVGLDSYFPLTGSLPDNAFGWDYSLTPGEDNATLYTKMAEGGDSIKIKIAPDPDDPTGIKGFDGAICASLVYKSELDGSYGSRAADDASVAGVPSISAEFAVEGGGDREYMCINVDSTTMPDLIKTPAVFEWGGDILFASKEAYIDIKMFDCQIVDEPVRSFDTKGCERKESQSSKFSLRPAFNTGSKPKYDGRWLVGEQYGDQLNPAITPYPYGVKPFTFYAFSATEGYVGSTFGAGGCPNPVSAGADGNTPLCVLAIDKTNGEVSDKLDANVSIIGAINSDSTPKFHWISYNDVGEINLTLFDRSWAKIDLENIANGHADCIENSWAETPLENPSSPDNGKIGCDTAWIVGDTVIRPSEFNISHFKVEGPHKGYESVTDATYVYYSKLGAGEDALKNEYQQFALVSIEAQALGVTGKVAPSYDGADGNYSNFIAHSITPKPTSTNKNDIPQKVVDRIQVCYYEVGNAASCDPSSSDTPRKVWTKGEAKLTYALNFDRDYKTPLPVLFMQANGQDLNISFIESKRADGTVVDDPVSSGAWWGDPANVGTYKKIDFIYGRASLPNVTSKTHEANLSFTIDYFSDRIGTDDGVRKYLTMPSALTSNTGWYRISAVGYTQDVNTSATIATDVDGVRFPVYAPGDKRLSGNPNNIAEYALDKRRPRRFVAHLVNLPTYLWYHQAGKTYSSDLSNIENRKNCFEHPCGTMEFLPSIDKSGWGGQGESDNRFYEDNSTRELTPYRLVR
ncbi:MAG: DUF11 domain-containing protein [Helicobacteraceae bacterium]|jgi:hypothetical protein|nr:DUF11 domain-containing protein [Helicobacteraceae bacterium]